MRRAAKLTVAGRVEWPDLPSLSQGFLCNHHPHALEPPPLELPTLAMEASEGVHQPTTGRLFPRPLAPPHNNQSPSRLRGTPFPQTPPAFQYPNPKGGSVIRACLLHETHTFLETKHKRDDGQANHKTHNSTGLNSNRTNPSVIVPLFPTHSTPSCGANSLLWNLG